MRRRIFSGDYLIYLSYFISHSFRDWMRYLCYVNQLISSLDINSNHNQQEDKEEEEEEEDKKRNKKKKKKKRHNRK